MYSGLENFSNANNILIIQKEDWLECCVPCCEIRNQYYIHESDIDFTEKKKEIGKIVENKGNELCLYCCKCFRDFKCNLEVNDYAYLESSRPYKIPLNCFSFIDFCKPEMKVTRNNDDVGKIEWPCWCFCYPTRGCLSCMEMDIRDQQGNLIYTVTSKCTQLGYLCWQFGFINSCSRREYSILDPSKTEVGKIINIYNGVIKELCTRADQYGINFPQQSTLDQKLLIINAAILLDYLQYMA